VSKCMCHISVTSIVRAVKYTIKIASNVISAKICKEKLKGVGMLIIRVLIRPRSCSDLKIISCETCTKGHRSSYMSHFDLLTSPFSAVKIINNIIVKINTQD
jgi:hypothetical protein